MKRRSWCGSIGWRGRRGISDDARYREYWAYLRHVETLRFQLASVVVVAGGAVLGWVVTAAGGRRGRVSLACALRANPALGWGVLLLGVFVGAAGFFLIAHKRNYDRYYDWLGCLDCHLREPGQEVFGWLLGMLTVVEAGVAAVLASWRRFDRLLWLVPVLIVVYWWVCWGAHWCRRRRRKGVCGCWCDRLLCALVALLSTVLLCRWAKRGRG
jgi:hypothetical protein